MPSVYEKYKEKQSAISWLFDCKFYYYDYYRSIFSAYVTNLCLSQRPMFTHLQVHTHYSLLEGIGSPKGYIEQAKILGMEALACTDYGGMYGGIEFYQAAKKAGIKPILGVELGYVPDRSRQDPNEVAGTIVLLARNYEGYECLMHLISEAHLNGFHKIPRIDHECLLRHGSGLISITGGERSRLGKQLLNHYETALSHDQRQQLTQTLGSENCYLSRVVQDIHQGILAECNQMILQFATEYHIPLIVSGDVHYTAAKDQHIFETALAIKDGKRIYDTDRRLAPRQMHLQTEDELRTRLTQSNLSDEQISSLFQTTQDIADRIDLQIPMDKILFPIYESPEDITTTYQKRQQDLVVS